MQKKIKLNVQTYKVLKNERPVKRKSHMPKVLLTLLVLALIVVGFLFKKANHVGLEVQVDSNNKVVKTGSAGAKAEITLKKSSEIDLTKVANLRSKGMPHDFLNGDALPKLSLKDWNLGPTGARGWMYADKLDTAQARQIYITQVIDGSPADGKLKLKDIILGVEEKLFSYDPRIELGKAIGEVEANDGKLSFIISRQGKFKRVELQLKLMGSYSETAPFSCNKSKLILKDGCERIAEKLKKGRSKDHWIVRSMNALALLASGEKKYLPLVKEEVQNACRANLKSGYHSWNYGPVNILVAEYIMATGDKSYLKHLERITQEIIDGSSKAGSWGHRFIFPDGKLGGYGMMNVVSLPITTSLILAKKAGAKNPGLTELINKTSRAFRFYVGKGSIGYSDGAIWTQTHDDNGKNGAAAVLFNILGDKEASAYFAKMSLATHGNEREQGHTGNFFNMLWAMPSVALNGSQASGAWMKEFGWYYDLARQWDGSFIHQGAANSKKDKYQHWDSTGAYMLAYTQALKKINITGKNIILKPLTRKESLSVIEDGRGWSRRLGLKTLKKRTDKELLQGLQSWSPIVRERSAKLIAEREDDYVPHLISMLKKGDLYTQLGACQACIALKAKAAPTVDLLIQKLKGKDLWLKVKATEALSAIGAPAKKAVPQLLAMFGENDLKDPRKMLQRYVGQALFNRGGMLNRSLEGVPHDQLLKAVKIGLLNENGRARGAFSSVYRNLKYDQIKPLLPAIKVAIEEPAPTGIMFNSSIQEAGLELFAKLKIKEGLPMAIHFIRYQKGHGSEKRTEKILKVIEKYGVHAKRFIPQLEACAAEFYSQKKRKGKRGRDDSIREAIKRISSLTAKPKLIDL